ncbi:hypothetical protein [Selenomonas ruminantium]|uniref:Uncharacterized protein n=1 Tax=Selenomonas ruminantium TaxID=971 RepID=A0A1H3YVU4_SELRU|nr:hypothetical protein [Selenomonas ruminantium]SEA15530.1 hypothetical protein SAMN05660648_02161 [Selenomonas ruminantium]
MSKSIKLKMYNVLDEDNSSYLNFAYNDCCAFFREYGSTDWVPLNLSRTGSATDNIYYIEGANDWNPDTCEVRLKQEITLYNLSELFITEDCPEPLMPIALENDVLGITAVWWSDKSKIRGCQYIDEIRYNDISVSNEKKFILDIKFPVGQLAGQLELFYKLFMKECGEKRSPGIAHSNGVLLGDIGTPLVLQIDGEGAVFPIYTVKIPNENLWWTEISIDDPFEDSFIDGGFAVYLNEAHPDYKELFKRNGAVSALQCEIIACALEELFIYLKNEFSESFDSVDLEDLEKGTIAFAVIYMINTFDIQMDADITSLNKSIRKAVSRMPKEAIKA